MGSRRDSAFAGFADVAEAGGVVHTVGEVHVNGVSRVLYRRQINGQLGDPVDLAPASRFARQPKIVASGQDVWVTWQDERSGEIPHNPQIYLRHSSNGGATWQPEQQVSVSTARAEHPDLALLAPELPVVVWQDNSGGAFDIYARVIGRDAAPVNLSTAGKTTTPGVPYDTRSAIYPASVHPRVAVRSDGLIAVAWQDNRYDRDPGWTGHMASSQEIAERGPSKGEIPQPEDGTQTDNWEILAATRAPGAAGWSAPVNVSNSTDHADRHAALAFAADGTLHAAWDSKTNDSMAGPRLSIRTSQSVNNGANWSPATALALASDFSSQRPVFGRNGDALNLFWMDGRSADWRWRVRRATLNGAAWNDAGFVTGRGNSAWPSYANGWLVFTSDRAAQREQRKPQQVYLLALNAPVHSSEPGGEVAASGSEAAAHGIAGCLLQQDSTVCAATVPGLAAAIQKCSVDDTGPNCAFNAAYDAIGVDEAAAFISDLFNQCATSPVAPLCQAIHDSGGAPDRVILADELVRRGQLVYAAAPNAMPSQKTVDGDPSDWMGQGSRIGGTSMLEYGEHIYSDYLFDAYGADNGDDARRLAAMLLLGDLNSRTGRIDQLFQALGDQFGAPSPVGAVDHYGDAADLEAGTDLTEARWASDGSALYFLARTTRLLNANDLVVLVLADTRDGVAGMQGLKAGLATGKFDRAAILRASGSKLIDLVTGASMPLPNVAVSTAHQALEAKLPLSLLGADNALHVAVVTARANGDGSYTPLNVAYRSSEPVAGVYNERSQALALYAGNVDGFTATIAQADLVNGRTQIARPGAGYHERQFVSGANISEPNSKEDGPLQHYGLYVPAGYDPLANGGTPLTIWLHYRGGKAHSGAAWTPRLMHELGDEQNNIVVTPRGRGTSTWYTARAHQDVFEVFADVAGTAISGNENLQGAPNSSGLLNVDADRVYLAGYSMGGYATYLFGLLYPDKFTAGYSTSGAATQGAWTGLGPDDSFCAPSTNPCFIEANNGRANAQLNYRLLENARHFPLVIHHGSNDELVPISGIQRFGARLLELGYRYDLTMFLGYEHFTQAIVDEWADGAHYLNRFTRPNHGNPRQVTYKVVPAQVKAVREAQIQPGQNFSFINPDGAYWVGGLVVRDGADGSDPTKFGQIDAESEALAGDDVVAVPTSQTSFIPPYLSTPVFSPGNHSTPYVRHGQDWGKTGNQPTANRFRATLINLSSATLDVARMKLDFSRDVDAVVTIEGYGAATNPAVELTLANVPAGLCVEDITGPGTVTVNGNTISFAKDGMYALVVHPGGSSCNLFARHLNRFNEVVDETGRVVLESTGEVITGSNPPVIGSTFAINAVSPYGVVIPPDRFDVRFEYRFTDCTFTNPRVQLIWKQPSSTQDSLPGQFKGAVVANPPEDWVEFVFSKAYEEKPAPAGATVVSKIRLIMEGNAGGTCRMQMRNVRVYSGNTVVYSRYPAGSDISPDYADLCASYGIDSAAPVCGQLRAIERRLREACVANGGSGQFCTLLGGNLHALLDACYLNNPGESQVPACRVVDAFVGGAAAYCRQVSNASGGAQRPEFCALIGGTLVSEEALQRHEQSWVHRALLLQNKLGYGLPLVHNSIVATHNSFNASDDNTPPTLSGSDYNQLYGIVDQLRMGVRAIEIDVHWAPGRDGSPQTFFREPMVCHGRDGSQGNVGCTTEKPLREELAELRAWLDAHPDEAVVLYLEDDIAGTLPADQRALAYATTAQVVADEIGDLVYGPGRHGSACDNSNPATDPGSWLNVSRRQILAAGKQLLLYTETCAGGTWDTLFHRKTGDNVTQGTQESYEGRGYEPGADNCVFAAFRRRTWTRVWEDSTVVTAAAGGGAPAAITPEVARELMRCGLNMPSLDRLYPADGRLAAMVWSWAENEPASDDGRDCAAQGADGRFFAAVCGETRPYACVSDTSPDQWTVSGSGPWDAAACPLGTHFGVPGNGYANEKLKEAKLVAGVSEVWLNYSDAAAEGVWEGDAVGGSTPRVRASFRTEQGLMHAVSGFLSDMVASAGRLLAAQFEAFVSGAADAFARLITRISGVLVANDEAGLLSALERLIANLRAVDTDNAARDFARDLLAVLNGGGAPPATGIVRAGVGVVDMTPDVGYCSGQYCDIASDRLEGAAGGDFDPYLTHKTKRKSDGVQSRLTARAIVVEGANGKRIALVKTDNYLAQDNLLRRVGQILAEHDSSIGDAQILHHVTHNHTSAYSSTLSWGPWLFEDAYDARFFENQARKIADAILMAEANLRPARMGATTVRHTIYKGNVVRLATADDGTPAGYPLEYGDHGLVVMRFDDISDPQNPIPLAVWINWGEHPESLDGPNMHSADFIAALERWVDRETGAPLVFSQGDVGSAENSGDKAQVLDDRGVVCGRWPENAPEPEYNDCPAGEGVLRDWDHRGFVQTERNVRYLADAIIRGYDAIGAGGAQVPFSSDFVVDYRNAWVPGPVSHPYPSVSNCRGESSVEGNPGAPVVGLPDCARARGSDARALMVYELMKQEGIPVPDHYDFTGFTGVEENLRLKLQAFRLGEVLLASCACEAQADLILNLESRADDVSGNIYDGFDWVCLMPEHEGEAVCQQQKQYYDKDEFPTAIPGDNFDPAAIARMRAQVHNDARGWDLPENAVAANSEPADIAKIWGNFTKEEIQDFGAPGYKLAVGIGHAGDYNGYTVSYREYMNRDHYRKALTSYGPHTADYMVTRLVKMAAALQGGPELAPEPHDTLAQADETRQVALAQLHGQATSSAFDAFYAALPPDLEPQIVAQPSDITRFQAATFTWRGGSTAVDNPVVRVQRLVVGAWVDAYDMSGEVQTRVHWPQGIPETLPAYAGQFEWLWTANFEAYTAFPARLGSTPPGRYRFVVEGRVKRGQDFTGYRFESQPFTVSPWNGIAINNVSASVTGVTFTVPPIVYPRSDAGAPEAFPYIRDDGNARICETCTFRPWAGRGRFEGAEVLVSRSRGGTEAVPASCTVSGGDAGCTADVVLLPGDTALVRAFDQDGNTGTAPVP